MGCYVIVDRIYAVFFLFFRVPLKCEFSEVGVSVSLPDSLFDVLLAIRALLVRYDHLSDLCPSFYPNALPEQEAKGKKMFIKQLI